MEAAIDRARSEPRTNLFVMASISATTVSGPTRIRDLSRNGALIEGAALPAPGEDMYLKRGPLLASGQVVWRKGSKAGLRFDRSIEVSEWLPSAQTGQQEVDRAFQQLKSGIADRAAVASSRSPEGISIDPDQLRRIACALDRLSDDFADDAVLVMRYSQKLQILDVTAQMLRKLASAGQRKGG